FKHGNEPLFRYTCSFHRFLEIGQGLVKALGSQLESAKMHTYGLPCPQVLVRHDRLRRAGMNGFHKKARHISTDAQHSQIRRSQPSLNIFKMRRIPPVSSKEDAASFVPDKKTAPKAFIPVKKPTGGGMLLRCKSDGCVLIQGDI